MENVLSLKDRNEWRNWLENNHDRETNVWLIIYRKGSAKKGVTLEECVEEAICFGWIDGKLKRVDKETFILRFSPRKANSVWSKINKERAEQLVKSGRIADAG